MKTLLSLLIVFMLVNATTAVSMAQSTLLTSFENPSDMSMVQTGNASASRSTMDATNGLYSLLVTYNAAAWPYVNLVPAQAWNWSAYAQGGVAVDITNPGPQTVNFGLRADDSPLANGTIDCIAAVGSLPPGRTGTFVLPFTAAPNPSLYGMRGLPSRFPGARELWPANNGTVDLSHIIALRVYTWSLSTAQSIYLDNVRLLPALSTAQLTTGIVDAFGQYTGATWPGKLTSAAAYPARIAAEQANLTASPVPAGRDAYGAWAAGPTLAATGYFRTAQYNSRWYLVAPNGHLFYSIGMDEVGLDRQTIVTGRTGMFTAAPPATADLSSTATSNGVLTYNYYVGNLGLKYGQNAYADWQSTSLQRLMSWGFNTIGAWSDSSLFGRGVPYTIAVSIWGGTYNTVPGVWGEAMPDPFDPNFTTAVASTLSNTCAQYSSDPYLVGVFVDNELPWPDGSAGDMDSLARGVLGQTASASPAKRAFLTQLTGTYATVVALNAAWGTGFATWNSLDTPYTVPATPTATQEADLTRFVAAYATRYYSIIAQEHHAVDPHHLYLGSRFATFTPQVIAAAQDYADVLSFNVYSTGLAASDWAFLAQTGRPALISEFHFGALDTGMFSGGLVPVYDQAERATSYAAYAQSVLAIPGFVGFQWFQYSDEPLTGRSADGENYNIGFVDVTDTPYPDLVSAAQQFNAGVYHSLSAQ
ncbi:MAG: beta-galactosidase [Capsulimonadaceae bacterium]